MLSYLESMINCVKKFCLIIILRNHSLKDKNLTNKEHKISKYLNHQSLQRNKLIDKVIFHPNSVKGENYIL